jgi:hypothetical protein
MPADRKINPRKTRMPTTVREDCMARDTTRRFAGFRWIGAAAGNGPVDAR